MMKIMIWAIVIMSATGGLRNTENCLSVALFAFLNGTHTATSVCNKLELAENVLIVVSRII